MFWLVLALVLLFASMFILSFLVYLEEKDNEKPFFEVDKLYKKMNKKNKKRK